jgi:hypothetical protein
VADSALASGLDINVTDNYGFFCATSGGDGFALVIDDR